MDRTDKKARAVNSYVAAVATLGATAFLVSAFMDPFARTNDTASVLSVFAFFLIALGLWSISALIVLTGRRLAERPEEAED